MNPAILKRAAPWPSFVAPPPERRHFAYPRKDAVGLVAVAPGSRFLAVDEKAMSATAVIATADQDRAGDVVVPAGCNLAKYRLNPVVFFGHQSIPFPVGTSEDGSGNLCVSVEPSRVKATCFFHQATKEAVQVFDLVRLGVLRCTSVGFNPISEPIPMPRIKGEIYPGQHGRPGDSSLGFRYDQWELLEWSWVGIPSNPYCGILREHLSKNRLAGEPIAPLLRKHLEPLAEPKKVWSPGWLLQKALTESVGTSGGFVVDEELLNDDIGETSEEETTPETETPDEEKGLFDYEGAEDSDDETGEEEDADESSPEVEKALSLQGLRRVYKRLAPSRRKMADRLLPGLKAAFPLKTAYAVAVTKAMEAEDPNADEEGADQQQLPPPPPMPPAPVIEEEEEEAEGLPDLIAKMTEAITQIQELVAGGGTSPDPVAGGTDLFDLPEEEEEEELDLIDEQDDDVGMGGDVEDDPDSGETVDEILQRYKKAGMPRVLKAFGLRHRDGLREMHSYLTEMSSPDSGHPSLAHRAACKLYAEQIDKMCKELEAEDAAAQADLFADLPVEEDAGEDEVILEDDVPVEEVQGAVTKAFEGIYDALYSVTGQRVRMQ